MNSILVIEDELHLRQSIIKYLALEEMAADGAATLQEARSLLASNNYRVVVLDLNLPDGDGIEFAREVPETTGIVIVSARGTLNQRLEGLRTGAYAYLVKPVELEELVAIIRNILGRLGNPPSHQEQSLCSKAAVTWKGKRPDTQPHAISVTKESLLNIPSAPGEASGTMKFQPIGRELLLCKTEYHPQITRQEACTDAALLETAFTDEVLLFTGVQKGSCLLRETGTGAEHALEPEMLLCRKAERFSDLLAFDAQSPCILQTLCISKTLLTNLLEPDYAEALEMQLGLAGHATTKRHEVSKMVSTLFHSCNPESSETLSQQLPKVHARIRTLMDRLAESLGLGNNTTPQEALSDIVENIYQELLSPAGSTITLNELAARSGYSSKSLNDGFRKRYGQSIGNFQLARRMLAAHDELLHTDTPIKAIASKHGYRHTNHFTTAFKKQFGYTPGALRLQRSR